MDNFATNYSIYMKHIIFFFLTAILASCSSKKAKAPVVKDDISRAYSWGISDAGLKTAVVEARNTIDSFTTALKSNNPALANFALKIRFPGLGGAEDVWANNIATTPTGFTGVLNNAPQLTTKAKKGDPVKFTPQNISDWMYTENGKLRGGFTIRLTYSRMTVKEKAKFDTAFVFKMQ